MRWEPELFELAVCETGRELLCLTDVRSGRMRVSLDRSNRELSFMSTEMEIAKYGMKYI